MWSSITKTVPQISRAITEDDDDLISFNPSLAECVLSTSPDIRGGLERRGFTRSTLMIVAMGRAACSFARSYWLEDGSTDIIAALHTGFDDGMVNSFSQKAPGDTNCYIHRLKRQEDVLLCLCESQVPTEQVHSWVQKLFSLIDHSSNSVLVLTSQSISNYRSSLPNSALSTPFMRSLKTSFLQLLPPRFAPFLEQPNLVEGASAEILTHCQLHRVPAALFIVYTDAQRSIDTSSVKAFLPLLQLPLLSGLPTLELSKAERSLMKMVSVNNQVGAMFT